jgi:hypothetical protein
MSTIRMIVSAKKERARLKEVVPARSKSREGNTYAPKRGAQGSHGRREEVVVASRSGDGRKVGAFGEAKNLVRRHAAPQCWQRSGRDPFAAATQDAMHACRPLSPRHQ